MKPLESFIESPVAGAIGWTLLHSLWEGAIISGVLAAVLISLRTPRARYIAACVAMVAMLSAFSLTLVWRVPESTHSVRALREPTSTAWKVLSDNDTSSPWGPSLAAIVPWLAPFWMAGVVLMYARRLAGCLSVQRLRSRGVCCASDHWQKELARLTTQLRISRPILLLESCLADAPMVLGHFHPLILMPVGLIAGLAPGQIQAILLHELAHLRRHDYLVNTIQRFVEGLFFYHPAVWWISLLMRSERENCCDDVVVSIRGNAHEYAVALATLEQNRLSGRQSVVALTGGNLVKRIRRLLYPKTNSPWAPFLAVTILMATWVVSLAAWESEPYQSSSSAGHSEAEGALGPTYSKWLNQDVVYIVDDAERAAFQRLTADQERDKFIEQFWLRHDPSPGTPKTSSKKSIIGGSRMLTSISAQHRARWVGRRIADTCTLSTARRMRWSLTREAHRVQTQSKSGSITTSTASATTVQLRSLTTQDAVISGLRPAILRVP